MSQGASGALRSRFDRHLGLWLPLGYVLALILISPMHAVFDEWGGVMQYFGGREILAGGGYHGWAAGFWPPLYSVLIALGSLFVDGFLAGKLISIAAGAALLYVAYQLALLLSKRRDVALMTQLFLVLTPFYVFESLQAHNHMLDAFLFVSGLLLFLRSLGRPTFARLFLVGAVCGLAGLARYTSYILLLLPFALFFLDRNVRSSGLRALGFWAGFSLVSLPWWIDNAVRSGSPLHTTEYLNACAGMFSYEWRGHNLQVLWKCNADYSFGGIGDVLVAFPRRYLGNVRDNLFQCGELLMRSAGILAPFAIPALLEAFVSVALRYWLILFGQLLLYVALASQARVPEYTFLGWTVVIVALSVMLISRILNRLQTRFVLLPTYHFRSLFMGLVILIALLSTDFKVRRYADDLSFGSAMVDAAEVTQALKEHDPDLGSKVIMAIDPGRAYYAGSRYLETPAVYDGPVEGLVTYAGLDQRIRLYAPKYPSNMDPAKLEADYLIYTRTPDGLPYWELQELPQFSFLLDPQSDRIPLGFELVYRSADVVVYQVR